MSWFIDRAELLLLFASACLAGKLHDIGALRKLCTRKAGNAEIYNERLEVFLFIALIFVPPFVLSFLPSAVSAIISFSISFFIFGYLISGWINKER